MVEALQSGNISSVLLEMYLPVKRKDLFNNSWFVVNELLEAEITHGVLLQGAGVSKLAKEMKNLILTNNIQTKYLTQQNDVEDQSKVRVETIIPLSDTSPQKYLLLSSRYVMRIRNRIIEALVEVFEMRDI